MPWISVLVIVAMVLALVDIITRDSSLVRFLPKFGWIILVILIPLIGTILWFTLGHEYTGGGVVGRPRRTDAARPPAVASYPPRDRPGPGHGPDRRTADTRSTEQQLADLDREIEYHRLRAELEQRKRDAGAEPAS